MPTYAYVCTCVDCSYRFDVHAPMCDSNKLRRCPKCKAKAEKDFSQAPVVYGDRHVWDTENGGKGRFNNQLKQWTTSVKDTEDKAAARGWCALHKD